VIGGLTFLGLRFSNTGHKIVSPYTPGPVQLVPKNPPSDRFTAAERRQVHAVASRFVATAVLRRNIDDSWEISAPKLREGLSRSEWAKGEIPIVPYPAEAFALARWRINYSYAHRVGLKVALYPKPESLVRRQVFDIEVQNFGTAADPRWLVSYWSPSGGAQIAAAPPGLAREPVIGTGNAAVNPVWLIVPVALVGGSILILLAGLGIRGRVRASRANRLHGKSL
jgi:hypothetical protein